MVSTSSSTTNRVLRAASPENNAQFAFFFFCIWAFVLLARPQDLFPVLVPLRPALTTGVLALGVVVLQSRFLPGPPLFHERQLKYYTALFVVMILGIPFALHRGVAFDAVFTGYINVILFVFVFYKITASVRRLSRVILISVLGAGLYASYALMSFVPGTERLSFASMYDPNDLAFFALSLLPLNLVFISRENSWWIRLACGFCFCMSILLILYSGSRGGIIAFGVVVVLLLLRKSRTISFSLKAVFVAVFLTFIAFSDVDTERYTTIMTIEDDYNIHDETGRLAIWQIGLRALRDNPFTGVGVGSYSRAVGMDRQERGEIPRWQSPHNSVIQIGTETGIFGLALFLLLSFNVIRILNRVKNNSSQERLVKIAETGMLGFVGLFIAGLFLSHAYSIYWAYYVALSAILNQSLVQESSRHE